MPNNKLFCWPAVLTVNSDLEQLLWILVWKFLISCVEKKKHLSTEQFKFKGNNPVSGKGKLMAKTYYGWHGSRCPFCIRCSFGKNLLGFSSLWQAVSLNIYFLIRRSSESGWRMGPSWVCENLSGRTYGKFFKKIFLGGRCLSFSWYLLRPNCTPSIKSTESLSSHRGSQASEGAWWVKMKL